MSSGERENLGVHHGVAPATCVATSPFRPGLHVCDAQAADRHIILLTAGTPGFPRNKYLEVATAHAKWQLTYVDLQGKASTEDYYSAGAVPTGRWFCLEWEFNDQPDHAAIWVDGDLVLATNFVSKVTGGRTGLVGAFTDLALGF